MNKEELKVCIIDFCELNRNEANIAKYSRYFKEAHVAFGLTQPQMILQVKLWLSDKNLTLDTILEAGDELIMKPEFEVLALILLMVAGRKKFYTKDVLKKLETWYTHGIHNWAHADTLGMLILPFFFIDKKLEISEFRHWINSPYKFQRRCVPVTLIKIIKTDKKGDFEKYFEFISPLLTDNAREVHQGVGWFLREAWKIQPLVTEKFLLKWKNSAPRLIIQYATEKMNAENKLRFKKDKKSSNF